MKTLFKVDYTFVNDICKTINSYVFEAASDEAELQEILKKRLHDDVKITGTAVSPNFVTLSSFYS
ncbi:MAG: hypothetical protein QXN55_00075 [Candidatus Nitrosotenuis sp.]